MKVQMAAAVHTMRQELAFRAPFVTLTSHVESQTLHISTKRIGVKTMRFRDTTHHEQGTMHLFKTPHVVLDDHYDPSEAL